MEKKMKIRVLPRTFFEKIKGTTTEAELLAKSKIISINSSWGFDDTPPFSSELLNHPHLLTLTFDDICNEPETPEDLANTVLFNKDMAKSIMKFVDDGKLPLLVHCTAGISRSGAVGEVLNWYFNCYLEYNAEDDEDFIQNNRQILPNTIVRKIMLKVLE
jgi:predicted protein tyrosine phosphatase